MMEFSIVLVTNQVIFLILLASAPKRNTLNVTFVCPLCLCRMILAVALAWGLSRHKYRVAALDMINRWGAGRSKDVIKRGDIEDYKTRSIWITKQGRQSALLERAERR